MKRLSTGVLAVLLAAGMGLTVAAAPGHSHGNIGTNAIAQASPAPAPPPMNFGSPPSGQIPILYNDHHVYAKPDKLKQGRVLAALVRGGTILIPLRSMFEQMGATVSYNPANKTVDVSKPGSDVKVTVGKPEVVINGETRPLDVPPEIYQGHVVVPVRVISEGMGAYVQWVPEKRLVVVRYIPAAPPAPPPPPPPPAPTPTPVPAPYMDKFIVGDYIFSPKVYNEFSPGNTGNNTNGGFSWTARAGIEFSLFNLPWMLEGDYRQWNYPHTQGVPTVACTVPAGFVPPPGVPPKPTPGCTGGNYDPMTTTGLPCDGLSGHAPVGDLGCVTIIGGQSNLFVPAFTARDYDFQGKLGLRVLQPRIYLGVGYMYRSGNYGYPHLNGWGPGIEKLPDLDQPFSIYGSAYYYFNVQGTCGTDVCPTGPFTLSYNVLSYEIGGTFNFGQSPLYLDFGFLGDRGYNRSNAPIDFTHNGGYVGLGLHF